MDGGAGAPAPLPHPPCPGAPGKTGVKGQAKGEEGLTGTGRTKLRSKNSTKRFTAGAGDSPQRGRRSSSQRGRPSGPPGGRRGRGGTPGATKGCRHSERPASLTCSRRAAPSGTRRRGRQDPGRGQRLAPAPAGQCWEEPRRGRAGPPPRSGQGGAFSHLTEAG